jgi:type IV pilus assembly protein PilC
MPTAVTEKAAGGLQALSKKMSTVKMPDLILFTKQFRTMFVAGISISQILTILEAQTISPKLGDAIRTIGQDIQQGSNLYNAFKRHGSIFSGLYCSLLRAGEISGTLPEVLDRLIYIIEHEYQVKKKIVSAMVYPIIVVVMLVLAFLFLLTFVIPKFTAMFTSSGVALPFPTRMCVLMYEGLKAYWHVMLLGLIGTFAGLSYYVRTVQGRFVKDTLLLRAPLFGPVVLKGSMSRFTSIFALLQASGVSVLDSVKILSDTIANSAIQKQFEHLESQLQEGRGIAGPLRSSSFFPPMVVNMIAIGEESGNLDEMLQEVSHHYDYEVEHAIGRMTELIGPILLVALTGVVGFFALSIYLPLVDIIKTMK